ncbi:MAG: pyruvate kinase [Firmicutes bacterium]|nr:pyruvate kinase [Candidatus Fermentithermobacillaceae bacterium]
MNGRPRRPRTKIVCTIGPACQSEDILVQMIHYGMSVARFNFSHGTREEHGARINLVKAASRRAGRRVGLMLDTRGPEIRLGLFEGGRAHLRPGQRFVLTTRDVTGNSEIATVTYRKLPERVSKGSRILLDDGNIVLEVDEVSGEDIFTKVLNDGVISDRKKVSVPGVDLGLPALDPRDVEDIKFGASLGIDFVAASFVHTAADILEVRRVLEESGSSAQIIAKIESVAAVRNLDEILKASDGLMVARGDLGVEFPPEEVPLLQKMLIARANLLGKPVITATQMLESMVEKPRPTRAEASDVANAIFDGTDAVMLSAETATGLYPVEAVRVMSSIALKAEESMLSGSWVGRTWQIPQMPGEIPVSAARYFGPPAGMAPTITEVISRAAVNASRDLKASAIVTPTESGYTARMVARFRPPVPILAVTPHEETLGHLTLVWGVEARLAPPLSSGGLPSEAAVELLRQEGLLEDGSLVVLTAGTPVGIAGTTNMLQIRTVGDVIVKGTGIGSRPVSGIARVAMSGEEALAKMGEGDILVTAAVDKSFVPALKKAGGLVMEQGGLTSDGAVLALQLNIPAVVGASRATKVIGDGERVTLDTPRGVVYRGFAQVR